MSKVSYGQSGYVDSSRSVGAAVAEDNGKLPLTRACRLLGLNPAKTQALVEPCEWHHTGKYARATNYYALTDLVAPRVLRLASLRRPSAEQAEDRRAWRLERIEERRAKQARNRKERAEKVARRLTIAQQSWFPADYAACLDERGFPRHPCSAEVSVAWYFLEFGKPAISRPCWLSPHERPLWESLGFTFEAIDQPDYNGKSYLKWRRPSTD